MPCSNCYNGCPEILSDQCVKYTGLDVPILGIQNGDSLSYVEAALVEFLTSTLDGTGIKPNITLTTPYLCNLVKQYLPDCEDITAANLFEALIKAACDLQVQVAGNTSSIVSIQSTLATLNANYNIGCLSGVVSSSDTHDVLQAVITKLCQFIVDVDALYVKIDDIDNYIVSYLDTNPIPEPDKWYNRMIPYTVVEFWGDINPDAIYPGSGFSAGGVGYGRFEKLYICNGQTVGPITTPDKRGRVTVGATQNVGGGAMDPQVNPGGFNPLYFRGTKTGTNSVTLTVNQIATHGHTATSVVVEPNGGLGHKHSLISGWYAGSDGRGNSVASAGSDCFNWQARLGNNVVDYSRTGITVNTTVASNGGNEAHANNQPAIGAFYIMYIP